VRHGAQEHRIRRSLGQQVTTHRLGQFDLAEQGPKIEENGRIEQGFRLRHADPVAELVLPFLQRQAPLRIAGHDIALA
jgi:hypothetical protein